MGSLDEGNRVEWRFRIVRIGLILLASSASFNIFLDVLLESGPPEPLTNREVGGSCAWVSCNWMVMVFLEDLVFDRVCEDRHSSVLFPPAFSLLPPMGLLQSGELLVVFLLGKSD